MQQVVCSSSSPSRGKQWGHEGGQSDNLSLQCGATDAVGKSSR